jgi:exopolysaccharide production protein ExoQ
MILTELEKGQTKVPWVAFLCLFTVFFFAQPYDLFRNPESYLNTDPETVKEKNDMRESGSLGRRIALLSLGTVAACSLLRGKRNRLRINGALGYLILLFLLWSLLSASWSEDALLTFKRLLVLGLLSLGGLAVANRFSLHTVIIFAHFACFISLLMGVFSEIAFGAFHPLQEDYRFGGVMHPNFQGWSCSILIIASVALYRKATRAFIRYQFLSTSFLAMLFLLLTKSRGALAAALVGLLCFVILIASHRRKMVYMFIAIITACLLYFIVGDDLILSIQRAFLLGRHDSNASTLTGRLPYWIDDLFPYINKQLILGYGYDSFWTPHHLKQIAFSKGWVFPDAHNTLIDIALGLGTVGATLYLLISILAVKVSIQYSKSTASIDYAFVAAIFVCSFVNGIFSSVQLSPFLTSFIYIVLLAHIAFVAPPLKTISYSSSVDRASLYQRNSGDTPKSVKRFKRVSRLETHRDV